VTHALGVIRGFARNDWEVIVISGTGLKDFVADLPDSLQGKVEAIEVKSPENYDIISEIKWLWSLRKNISEILNSRSDIEAFLVRYAVSRGEILALLARKIRSFGINTVLEVNSLAFHQLDLKGPFANLILEVESFILSSFDIIYVVTEQHKEDIEGKNDSHDVLFLPNASFPRETDFDVKSSSLDTSPRFVYMGVMHNYYDFETVTRSFGSLKEKYDSELHFFGDGEKLKQTKKLAEATQGVKFHGRYQFKEINEIVEATDILLHPHNIGLSTKLFEYFSLGLPIIAAREGKIDEFIEDGETGFLYEPGNENDLSSVMEYVLEHPEERKLVGERALKVFKEKHTWKSRMAELIENLEKINS